MNFDQSPWRDEVGVAGDAQAGVVRRQGAPLLLHPEIHHLGAHPDVGDDQLARVADHQRAPAVQRRPTFSPALRSSAAAAAASSGSAVTQMQRSLLAQAGDEVGHQRGGELGARLVEMAHVDAVRDRRHPRQAAVGGMARARSCGALQLARACQHRVEVLRLELL